MFSKITVHSFDCCIFCGFMCRDERFPSRSAVMTTSPARSCLPFIFIIIVFLLLFRPPNTSDRTNTFFQAETLRHTIPYLTTLSFLSRSIQRPSHNEETTDLFRHRDPRHFASSDVSLLLPSAESSPPSMS